MAATMRYNTYAPMQRGSAERAVTVSPHQGECLEGILRPGGILYEGASK